MSRPLRIQYPDAWYHVMNRGARRQEIYPDDAARFKFLALTGEMSERYGVECHAYCLMDNHYHLLLHTPFGNLFRGMRHLNGLYTQYVNARQGTDGPLFRGRYKSILIEADAYLLQVSRYIHRNPLAAGMVKQLQDYPWSSYSYYLDGRRRHAWLFRDEVLAYMKGVTKNYGDYVESEEEKKEISRFYERKRLLPIMGTDTFIEKCLKERAWDEREMPEGRRVKVPISEKLIIGLVSKVCGLGEDELRNRKRPKGTVTIARNMAMYLCQKLGQKSLYEIAEIFGLGHYTSVSSEVGRFRKMLERNKKWAAMLERVEQRLTKVNSNT